MPRRRNDDDDYDALRDARAMGYSSLGAADNDNWGNPTEEELESKRQREAKKAEKFVRFFEDKKEGLDKV